MTCGEKSPREDSPADRPLLSTNASSHLVSLGGSNRAAMAEYVLPVPAAGTRQVM